ncbi:DoxX-like family protein [Pseudonocardia ammonioxydans]|uniref:DoxX-like family protein n=1 Tax=Pseudonocardia ammonioxydans TaxID=260086 RepID=A0A1I5GRQ3_PSUAM|nr:DoxX family protein [Pseudonocardia ammonioxydans]SFO38599.1 DoxX-like family protein [Pseudonocardia ammonioxydans]
MSTAYVVLAALLAVVLAFSAYGKLTRATTVVQNLDRAGVPGSWYPWLAAAEAAGAIGLVAGIWLRPLGIAAAIGVVLYFVGAVVAHVVHRDTAGIKNPAPLLVAALAATVTGVLSA